MTVEATKKVKKKLVRFVMLRTVMFVLLAVCLLIGFVVLGIVSRNHPLPFALYYASTIFAFYPLGLVSCETTVKVHFEYLQAHFKMLNEKLATMNSGEEQPQTNFHSKKKGNLEEIESLTDQGLALVECTEKMDRALGRMMLTQAGWQAQTKLFLVMELAKLISRNFLGIYTLNEIVLLYFLSISYPMFEKLRWVHLLYGIANEIIVVNNTWQKFHLFDLSQTLTNLKRKCWSRLVKRYEFLF